MAPSHGCQSFTLAYWQDGVRKRQTFSTFQKARDEATLVVNRLGSAEGDVLLLKSADGAAYLRTKQIVGDTPIEVAAAQFVQLRNILGDTPPIIAAEYYKKTHQTKPEPKTVKEAVDELIKANEGMWERIGALIGNRPNADS